MNVSGCVRPSVFMDLNEHHRVLAAGDPLSPFPQLVSHAAVTSEEQWCARVFGEWRFRDKMGVIYTATSPGQQTH